MKKHLLIIPLISVLTGSAFAQCPIADQEVITTPTTICDGGNIQISNSERGVNYYLRKDVDNAVVAGPISGVTGNALTFSGPGIKNAITYNVYASVQQTEGLHFNGADQFVLATNDEAIQTSQGTYEAWFKTTDAGSSFRGIVVKQLAASLFLYNNELGTYDWTAGWRGTGLLLNDNKWHHVAVTFDSGVEDGTTIYLDGAPVLTTSMTVNAQSEALAIGNGYDTQREQDFAGDISEVRIWNIIRTGQEISDNYSESLLGTETGLVSYYQFSDGTGSTILTDRVSGLNGTFTETMDPATAWVEGPSPFAHASCDLQLTGKATASVKNSATGTEVKKACGNFVWIDGNIYPQSNTTATFNIAGGAANGCDSLVTLDLTINYATSGTDIQHACKSFLWIDGITYTDNNTTATKTLINAAGCDSVVTLNLSLQNIIDENVIASAAAVCDSGAVVISTEASQTGVKYYLRNDTDNSLLDSLSGTGATLEFKAIDLKSSVTYNVYAISTSSDAYLNFNGNSQYVSLANSANIPVGNSNYAIEAWIKPHADGANGIVGWGTWGAYNQVNAFRFDGSTTLINYWWSNDLYVQVPDLNDGVWHHVAATFDGTTRSIFLDGKLAGSDQPSGHNVDMADNFRIGSTNAGEYYKGGIREVRIWNISKTEAEIAASMNKTLSGTETGLVSYYIFKEEADNTVLTDVAGGDNSGTLENMDPATAWVSGSAACFLELSEKPAITVNKLKDIDNTVTINGNGIITALEENALYQWIDCNNHNLVIDGETDQSFKINQYGSYAVILSQGACIDTSSCIGTVTATQENAFSAKIKLYPNPTSDDVTIDLGSNAGLVNYTLTSLDGKIIAEGKVNENSPQTFLKEESKGMYFLRLSQEGATSNYKIIKQ